MDPGSSEQGGIQQQTFFRPEKLALYTIFHFLIRSEESAKSEALRNIS
jgi:hypothetical protein